MIGAYADTTTTSSETLGAAHELLSRDPIRVDSDCLVLHTCQRVEVYGTGPLPELADLPGSVRPRASVGEGQVMTRLTEIAAGLRSEVVGERFVHEQLSRARRGLRDGSAVAGVVDEALDLAARLRARHSFDAHIDYPGLAFDLLDPPAAPDADLVIVGSGLLAQALAEHPRVQHYGRVLIVTRSPKRLRKRRTTLAAGQAVTVARALEELPGSPWDVVIATSNLDARHREALTRLIGAPGRRTVVDLCCVPVTDRLFDDRHFTLYHESFAQLVGAQNASVADLAQRVQADLLARCEATR